MKIEVLGPKKSMTYFALVVVMSTVVGMSYGALVG